MKVVCAICKQEAEDGECTRAMNHGDSVYAHDACALRAFALAARRPGFSESMVDINNRPLNHAQSMTLRVAVSSFASRMSDEKALGDEEHGKAMRLLFLKRIREVERMFFE